MNNKLKIKATYITVTEQGIPCEYQVKFTMPMWDNLTEDYATFAAEELPQDDDWIAATISKGRTQVRKEIGGTAFWDLDCIEIFSF